MQLVGDDPFALGWVDVQPVCPAIAGGLGGLPLAVFISRRRQLVGVRQQILKLVPLQLFWDLLPEEKDTRLQSTPTTVFVSCS